MAASSSSTFSATNPNISYCPDVFLNHRGVDVKKTFARSLYIRLSSNGLKAFLDQEELQAGYNFPSQIEQAIKTARVHVAIFSPRYAESEWCLRELVMMLESKAPIIPVFYRVQAAEVRWIKDKYAGHLQRLAEKKTEEGKPRYDSKDIDNWRAALSHVADNKGFELDTFNGEEFELELLDKVVKCLLEMVKKPDLHVAKYPTGLDEKLKDFEDTVLLSQQQKGKSQILGIVGLGGVGKTTLAKEFFNRNNSSYHKSCFLSDVRENAAKGCLTSLQGKLLKSLTSIDVPIDSVDEGKGMLIKHLKSSEAPAEILDDVDHASKALIILDDVDHLDQVDALLPVNLSSGSLILITSRDRHVLICSKAENSSIYNLTGLKDQHSRELFCSHAFNQTDPLEGFESLTDSFLKACNGLPLALKVFGANLFGRDRTYWEDELESFPVEIKDRLKISFDALDNEEKQIFLDIACFFRGQDRDMAISIWKESGWKGRRGIQNLQDKCLVVVDSSNDIQMHDQIRDMGRDVAEKSSPHRLWRWTDNVIDNQESSVITVRGMKMDLSEYNAYSVVLSDIGTGSLRILDTEGFVLERILRRAELPDIFWRRWFRRIKCPCTIVQPTLRRTKLPNILWLRWLKCPYSSLPSWIPMKNLRFLEVSGSVLNTLWESESQAPLHLPVFLEVLRAQRCVTLKSITGLEQLKKLRQLNVSGCPELQELPSIETLASLEKLLTARCVQLKSIRGLAQCTRLRMLCVEECSQLEELPSMEALVYLEELWVGGCVQLKSIRGLAQCTRLRNLSVSGCSALEELPCMETLVSLEEFWAPGCVQLKSIRGLAQCTRLRMLCVEKCSQLEELPSMETLVYLEELWAGGCVQLKSIRGLAHCTRLQKLSVYGCYALEELPCMETLVYLEELCAGGCVQLKSIWGLAQCTRLRKLSVSGCYVLEELPCMETLVYLEELWAPGCVQLKSIRGLAQCTRLRNLYVRGCSELEEVEGVEHCTWVEKLDVSKCPNLQCPVPLWE